MVITEMFFWWYASGWNIFIKKFRNWIINIADFFSMDSLVRTLFKPFRQISANTADSSASLDLKFHMFIDRFISRLIGFISRLILLIVGIIIILIGGILGLFIIILWPLIPFIPIVGIVLSTMGFII